MYGYYIWRGGIGYLSVAHNLPRAMHGCNRLNEKSNSVTCEDALTYTYNCMDDNMKNKYAKYFE